MNRIRIAAAATAATLALAGLVGCDAPPPGRFNHSDQATPRPGATSKATAGKVAPTKTISVEQQNATRAAQGYLDMQPFSRKGLIQQLSSSAGDGFPEKVATAAVDSLHVDYNAQAAKAAKGYLALQPFSRNGLIQQLESSSGDGYTHAQAAYGVTKAGL